MLKQVVRYARATKAAKKRTLVNMGGELESVRGDSRSVAGAW
jgi:hypothetical protein